MAVVVTITAPQVTVTGDSVLNISVEAIANDKDVEVGRQTFTTTSTRTTLTARDAVAKALASEIIAWRAKMESVNKSIAELTELKAQIEALL